LVVIQLAVAPYIHRESIMFAVLLVLAVALAVNDQGTEKADEHFA
jgi:hypothetical protein